GVASPWERGHIRPVLYLYPIGCRVFLWNAETSALESVYSFPLSTIEKAVFRPPQPTQQTQPTRHWNGSLITGAAEMGEALRDLREDTEIVVKPADKGGAIPILRLRQFAYGAKMETLLRGLIDLIGGTYLLPDKEGYKNVKDHVHAAWQYRPPSTDENAFHRNSDGFLSWVQYSSILLKSCFYSLSSCCIFKEHASSPLIVFQASFSYSSYFRI
ncbi:Hypothetical predicted protein, partial [Pelobates cultripes]